MQKELGVQKSITAFKKLALIFACSYLTLRLCLGERYF